MGCICSSIDLDKEARNFSTNIRAARELHTDHAAAEANRQRLLAKSDEAFLAELAPGHLAKDLIVKVLAPGVTHKDAYILSMHETQLEHDVHQHEENLRLHRDHRHASPDGDNENPQPRRPSNGHDEYASSKTNQANRGRQRRASVANDECGTGPGYHNKSRASPNSSRTASPGGNPAGNPSRSPGVSSMKQSHDTAHSKFNDFEDCHPPDTKSSVPQNRRHRGVPAKVPPLVDVEKANLAFSVRTTGRLAAPTPELTRSPSADAARKRTEPWSRQPLPRTVSEPSTPSATGGKMKRILEEDSPKGKDREFLSAKANVNAKHGARGDYSPPQAGMTSAKGRKDDFKEMLFGDILHDAVEQKKGRTGRRHTIIDGGMEDDYGMTSTTPHLFDYKSIGDPNVAYMMNKFDHALAHKEDGASKKSHKAYDSNHVKSSAHKHRS